MKTTRLVNIINNLLLRVLFFLCISAAGAWMFLFDPLDVSAQTARTPTPVRINRTSVPSTVQNTCTDSNKIAGDVSNAMIKAEQEKNMFGIISGTVLCVIGSLLSWKSMNQTKGTHEVGGDVEVKSPIFQARLAKATPGMMLFLVGMLVFFLTLRFEMISDLNLCY